MKNVLVIDDSGTIRLMVRQMLRDTNCKVFEAANATQVIHGAYFRTLERMDLVLLDLYLGEEDGFEVLKTVTSAYPDLPVIMMSIERKKESILRCIELGAKDYIIKPFTKDILLSRMRRFINIVSGGEIEKDIKDFENILHSELDRAIRVDSPLAVMFLKVLSEKDIGQNVVYSLQGSIKNLFRRIDSVLVCRRVVALVLPLADKEGLDIVRGKVGRALAEAGIGREHVYDRTFLFPDDVSKKELIRNFDLKSIADLIMHIFHGMIEKGRT